MYAQLAACSGREWTAQPALPCPSLPSPQLFDHLDWPAAVEELKQAEKFLRDGGAIKARPASLRAG